MLVIPLSRPSLLIGRSLKEMVPLARQAVVIVAVMHSFGFRLYPASAVTGLLLLAVFGVGLGYRWWTEATLYRCGSAVPRVLIAFMCSRAVGSLSIAWKCSRLRHCA